jgi:rod shape-determining protein MreD
VSGSSGNLVAWQWIGVPFAACILLTVLFAIPLRVFGLQLPEPVFAMWPAFAWAMIRPSILGPTAVLLLGLFLDIYWGGPLGLWAIALLSAYAIVLSARTMMIGQSDVALVIWYAVVTAVAFAVGVLITMMKTSAIPNLYSVLWQYLATVVLYPFAQRHIERFEDADVRFR